MEKKIYLVGGAVRDRLLGLETYDKDFVAVGFDADDFSHLKLVGKDFPVFIDENGCELALARVEKKVSEGYNGFATQTKNVTLEEDLKRRDLTINSMAYDELNDKVIDPFNGKTDLEKKVLRHTSEAFVEDPLRVLRVARFRAKLGYEWKIAPSTKVLIYKMKEHLKELQPDRVYREIEKVLDMQDSHLFFETLFELGVLDAVFPSLYELTTLKEGSVYHMENSCFIHTMMVLKNLSKESRLLKLSALYHDIAKPSCYRIYGNSAKHDKIEIVEPLLDMQVPSKMKKRMLFIIQNHIRVYILDTMKPSKVAQFFESFKKDRRLLEELILFADADNQGRICMKEKKNLPRQKLLNCFDLISSYSPKSWIDSHEKGKVSSEAIKQHIHKYNIDVVKKEFF
jgi:tRNA nucleotidyltransferase (CCA-adding enzyme)